MFTRRGRDASISTRPLLTLFIWIITSVWLLNWWFGSIDSANLLLYIPLSFAIVYEYVFIPAAFLFFLYQIKIPRNRRPAKNIKVAVITLCVPSMENISVIEKQLKAMNEIIYPHDSWILDEGNSSEIRKLARKYKVKYFTRKNIAKYNQSTYPYKAKTKAGNVNSWLHKVRNKRYDYFVQMDIDHNPKPNYLDKTLGHFKDKNVGWVQAPSVYRNLENWTSRGAAEQEMGFNGPLQMGFYGWNETPVVVGSHTTFRMKAIEQIGGFQQTRAEDHLNTLALMSKGYKGVYIPDIIAEGDGPETFDAYLSQQYAWAYSMFQILKSYSYKFLKQLSFKRKLQFLFLETWYPLWSISYSFLFIIPVLGLLLNTYAFEADGLDFVIRFTPSFISLILVLRVGQPYMQPKGLSLSWRGMLLHVVRWPVIIMAICSSAFGRVKPYQITPKGKFLRTVPTTKLYKPFLILSIVSALSIFYSLGVYGAENASGLLIFVSANLVTMTSICLVDLNLRIKSRKISHVSFKKYWLKPAMAVTVVTIFASFALGASLSSSQQIIYAITPENPKPLVLKEIRQKSPYELSSTELELELSSYRDTDRQLHAPSLGLYQPVGKIKANQNFIRHTFRDWHEDRRMAVELVDMLRHGNTPLITIEPKGEEDGNKLLTQIIEGKHDKKINKLTTLIGLSNKPTYVRFAHEMEIADLYPWGNKNPEVYKKAYIHFINLADKNGASNIKWVWGPGGHPDASKYYPGNKYVDVIGTTILYDSYWNGDRYVSFYNLAKNRLWLLQYGKPLWITELGIGRANPEIQHVILQEAISNYKILGFDTMVYVNIPDSNIDGPDYRLNKLTTLTNHFEKNKLTNNAVPEREEEDITGSFEINNKPIPKYKSPAINSPEELTNLFQK